MPVNPQAQQMAQLQRMIMQAQSQALLNNQSLGPTPMGPHSLAGSASGAGTGNTYGLYPQANNMGSLQGLPPVTSQIPMSPPQTLGMNQPVSMLQPPNPDPTGNQTGQAPDISYGMSLGDIPSGG